MFTKSQQPKTTTKQSNAMSNSSTAAPAASRSDTVSAPRNTPETAPSVISADMRVSGDLRTDGDVQIDGIIDGDISSNSLTIGKSAVVNGEVAADIVRVWGKVNGRIRSKDVSLQETAEVHGDILHHSLEVVRGAYIEGMVKRDTSIGEAVPERAPQRSERPRETARVTSLAGADAAKGKSSNTASGQSVAG